MPGQHQQGATRQLLGALRDVMWCALPGGLFLAIGVISGRISLARLAELLAPYHPPTWALSLLLIAACYLAGHILGAIAYLRADLWKLFHLNDPDWLAEYPTEVNARDIYLRHYFPEMLSETDRRQRLALLLWSSVAALLLGWLAFYIFRPTFADVIIWAAVLVFLDVVTLTSHLSRARKAIHEAGAAIEEHDKALRESEKMIYAKGDELRFMIDAIFRAVELASPNRPARIQSPAQASATAPSGIEAAPQRAKAAAASSNSASRNGPDV